MPRSPILIDDAGYDDATKKANAALIGDFLAWLRRRKWSPKTRQSYEVTLRQFYNYCSVDNLPFADVTPQDANLFIIDCLQHYAANTQRLKISTLRSFYDYAQSLGVTDRQPFLQSYLPKKEETRFTYITNTDFAGFIAYLEAHSSYPLILGAKLMRYAGLRVSEACDIDINNDIRPSNSGYDVYVKGKGGKERAVPIFSADFCAEVKQLQALYPSPGLPIASIFAPATMAQHLTNYSKQAGVNPTYTTHDLRRAFAVDLMQQTGNIEIVRMALGHSEYTTTLIYIRDQYNLVKAAAGTVRM